MWPTAFGLPTYGLFLLFGIAAGVAVAAAGARRCGFRSAQRRTLWLLAIGGAPIGLVGAKLDSLLERGAFESLLSELHQGFRYPGAIVALVLSFAVYSRLRRLDGSILAFGDAAAPAASLALAVIRVGCFMAGCCHGTVSAVPWAMSFPPYSIAWQAHVSAGLIRADAAASLPVHPLQLYFALWSLGLGVFLLWLAPRRAYAGQVLLSYLALDNMTKFVLEFLRDPSVAHLRHMSLAIAVLASALLLIGWLRGGAASTASNAGAAPRPTKVGSHGVLGVG